jgi:sugar O-acyltransferase (sialic acid O-acetyltransferase NeuD family)
MKMGLFNLVTNLLIFGAGGHGMVVKETAEALGIYREINFLDDRSDLAIGKCKDYKHFSDSYSHFFVAFGDNEQRMNWIEKLIGEGYNLPRLVHPTAFISPSANIEKGSIVCVKAVVNTNVKIKKGCIIGIGALIDHDSSVGEYSHINSGSIVKAGCKVNKLMKIDAGLVCSNELKESSLKVGV